MSDDLRDIVVLIDGREHVLRMPAHDRLPNHPVLGAPYGGRDMMLYVPRDGNGVYAWREEEAMSTMSRLDMEARRAQQVLLQALDKLRTLGQEIPTAREDLDDVMVSVEVAIDCLSAILGEER